MEYQWKREDFRYATLFNPKTKLYCTDNSEKGLIRGPETEKRFQENSDNCAVTVCCITYNHEHLIRQALDSFLSQKTNFKYQVFVGEDCGPDGTANIVREYAEKYPDIIVPFIREKNMGAQSNLIDLCQRAHSPYIAFCEGDDYWIDDYKLQKQFDYMQAHEDVRMCYTRTQILAPDDWHLNSYYKHDKDGRMIIPDCTPGFKKKDSYDVKDFISIFPLHTSSAFYRWNFDLDIPDWYYRGIIGDASITMLQMGMGKAVYLPDVTSVYRRTDVGVFMNNTLSEHFKKTRLDYLRVLTGLRGYFKEHFDNVDEGVFKDRIALEITNYLSVAEEDQDDEMILHLLRSYPDEVYETLHTYIGSYKIYSTFQKKITKRDLINLTEKRRAIYFAIPGIKIYNIFHGFVLLSKKTRKDIKKYIYGWFLFWENALVTKQKNLWVFSGFRHSVYMDNTMYLYEYILEHHPEIQAVWLTTNPEVYKKLRSEMKPIYYMTSQNGIKTMKHAAVAITDHFVMSDYSPEYGFNACTKVVQLWHSVSFKSMGDEKSVRNTKEKGVQYSLDIIAQKGDSTITKARKKIKYFFLAPFRERFEEYFMFICPGMERVKCIADVWKVPEKARFMVGHPRDLPVYTTERQLTPIKIMYAPTYRFDFQKEQAMVNNFLDVLPDVQKLMEEIDGEFSIRMHPHTWRNYKGKINRELAKYDRIILNDEKDIYQTIGSFSIMVTDYSGIGIDFAVLDRPVIFYMPDYEWYSQNDAGFSMDVLSSIPGPATRSWEENLMEIRKYAGNLQKDKELRAERIPLFFDRSVNGPDNSERIVQELKRRLEI